MEGNLHFKLSWASLKGAYIQRGNVTGGFLHYKFGGLIFGGAYFQNFTVSFIVSLDLLAISSCTFFCTFKL